MQYRKLNNDLNARILNKNRELKKRLFNFFNKSPFTKEIKDKIAKNLSIQNQRICKHSIKNICLESGWEKNILSKFKVSRHIVKKNTSKLTYPGVRKASW